MTPPLAFTFNGIKVYIYDEDHPPIHIHAQYNGMETVYELIIDNGKLVSIATRQGDFPPLKPAENKKVHKFLKKNFKLVVEKWTTLVIYKKKITLTRISGL